MSTLAIRKQTTGLDVPESCKNLRLFNALDVGDGIALAYTHFSPPNDSETITLRYDHRTNQIIDHRLIPIYRNYFRTAHYDPTSERITLRQNQEVTTLDKDWNVLGTATIFPYFFPYAGYNTAFSNNSRFQVCYLGSNNDMYRDTFGLLYTLTPQLNIIASQEHGHITKLLVGNNGKIYTMSYVPLTPVPNIINYVGDIWRTKIEVRDIYLNLLESFLPADSVVQFPAMFQIGDMLVIGGTHYPQLDDTSGTTGYLEFRPMRQDVQPTIQCGSYNVRFTGNQILILPYETQMLTSNVADFILYDALGRKVGQRHLNGISEAMEVGSLASGIYTGVLVCSNGGRSVLRFLKQ